MVSLTSAGAADQFANSRGKPPDALLQLLNQGPGAHIRSNAFRYDEAIRKELARIGRVRGYQTGFFNALSHTFLAGMITAFQLLAQAWFGSN